MNNELFNGPMYSSGQTDAEERALRHLAESHDEDKSGDDETAEATATAASACAMSDLAMVLQEQGKLTEAEELFRCVRVCMHFFL